MAFASAPAELGTRGAGGGLGTEEKVATIMTEVGKGHTLPQEVRWAGRPGGEPCGALWS